MGDLISLVVSPIVEALIGNATSLIKQKFQLLQGVQEDIEKLSRRLDTIQSVVEDAEDKQLDDRMLSDWLGKLKAAACDAEDVLETYAAEALRWQKRHQVRHFQAPVSPSEIAYKLEGAQEIKNILARLEEIETEKQPFNLIEKAKRETHDHESSRHGNRESDLRARNSFVVKSDVVGREDEKNRIVDMLLSKEFDREEDIAVLPIIGMAGLGKTTLAQLVYNDDRVKKHFASTMWVSVTVNFDYRRIVKEMMGYHSEIFKYDINSLSDNQLESRLLELFLVVKPFLLVLDDVWIESYGEWESLQKLLKMGGKGSRVLVTSRNKRVSEIMGTQPPHPLDSLPEEQCWSLFEKIAFKEHGMADNVSKELEDAGRKIVKKCSRLPLAVKAMAGLLRGNNNPDKWREILKHEVWEAVEESSSTHDGKETTVLPALKLSYNQLLPHLKQCFAYCSIFPKAYVFDKSELVKLWKAESFIPSKEGYTTDEIGSNYFDELLMRSFFQLLNIDNKERYKMHDFIYYLARKVSVPHCYQVKDNEESCSLSDRTRHVSLLCKDVEKHVLEVIDKSKKLHTLLLPGEYRKAFGQALDKMFRGSKYIRVLDLSSTVLMELPNSVEELKLLRYLDLSKTEIRALPNSICSLYNLQTLKLLGCVWLFELPKDLANLVNLEHLELDDMFWFKASALPPRLGSLTRLQDMHAFRVSHENGYGIDELKDMNRLTGILHISKLEDAVNAEEARLKDKERLKKLVFEWSNSDGGPQDVAADHERVLEDLQPHSNLQVLQLLCYKGSGFPSWMRDGLLQELVGLSLIHCSRCKVMSLGQLKHLGELNIKGMLELQEWPEAWYPSLRRLKISNCPKLRKLPRFFPALTFLKIKKCDSLKTLPLNSSLMFLILVDNLVLEDWNEKHVGVSSFNLLELKIINCPKLQSLPEQFAPQKLEISGCQLLNTLPIPELSQRLQHLLIDACHGGTLVKAIPDTSSLYSLVISNISGLSCLPKLPHLSGLKALHIRYCSDLVSLYEEEEEESFQGLPALKLLSIQDCPQLVTLPEQGLPTAIECLSIGSCPSLKSLGTKETLKNLTSLKDLYIDDCTVLESLPEEGLPNSLQHLHIEGCPLLLKQCQHDKGLDWPKIMHIPDKEIKYIEVSSTQNSPKEMEHTKTEASSAAWYRHFVCCKGTETRESEQPQQLNSNSLMEKDKGQTSKGKMEQ